MSEVVTLGECLIAFVADEIGPLADATTFHRFVAGAEANLAVGVTRLGHSAAYLGRVGGDGLASDRPPPPRRGCRHHAPERRRGCAHGSDVPRATRARASQRRLHAPRLGGLSADRRRCRGGRRGRDLRGRPLAAPDRDHARAVGRCARRDGTCRHPRPGQPDDRQPRSEPAPASLVGRGGGTRTPGARRSGRRHPWQPRRVRRDLRHAPRRDRPTELARAALALGPTLAIVKLGAVGGSLAATRDEVVQRPALALPVVVDPVGAGDAFCAGFIAARLDGATLPAASTPAMRAVPPRRDAR